MKNSVLLAFYEAARKAVEELGVEGMDKTSMFTKLKKKKIQLKKVA
ncbi:MAG: hypothetical protein ACK5LE_08940 [Alphaproteobacteria bacterium]